jgi:hypothetical protein
MNKTRVRTRRPQASRTIVATPDIHRGRDLKRVILKRGRKPLTRAALHTALDPVVGAWLAAACVWDEHDMGDHKFVIFSTDVAPRTQVYAQFWSEPGEPVLWEVSSGKWNPPADKWLEGDRLRRVEALGFAVGGEAKNYQRHVMLDSPAALAAIASEVVELFYNAFDYRGITPLHAHLVYEGRSELRPTFDAFAPEDLGKVFAACGYRVEEAEIESDDEPPLLRCRKRTVTTTVEFDQGIDDEGLFGRATLSCELPVRPEDVPDLPPVPADAGNAVPVLAISTVLLFSGGVTIDWLIARVQEWTTMIVSRTRRPKPRQRVAKTLEAVIH